VDSGNVDASLNLRNWWLARGRRFPWRENRTPYRVLVSEVLLHRTRAGSVARIYERFVERYPSPAALAAADDSELAEMLRPLGLRWRTELIGRMAREIVERFGGEVPCDRDALLSLPGVGDYIASAVLVFGCGKFAPLLDTNIVRIIARYHGVPASDGSRRSARFAELLSDLVDPSDPAASYYALIDLGALVCRPHRPRCGECPIRDGCHYAAGRTGMSSRARSACR